MRCPWGVSAPDYLHYHDTEWAVPLHGETALFERISLEAFQSGLSWLTILRKRENFRAAFADFDPDRVAAFDESDISRLLGDAGIVRNRRKIDATITNARATLALRDDGGLAEFVWSFQPDRTPMPDRWDEIATTSPESIALSKALKKRGFAHVGPTKMHALMEAIGIIDTHLVGSHRRGSSGVWPA